MSKRAYRHKPLILTALTFSLVSCSEITNDINQLKSQMEFVQSRQADQSSKIEELQSSISSLTGRVEEIEYGAKGRAEKIEKTLQEVTRRMPPPAGVPLDLLEFDEQQISKHSGAASDLFKQGLKFVRGGNFDEAKKVFKKFTDSNPNTTFTDNALFWKGLSHELVGELDLAIVAYSEVFRQFPAEDRVSASLYNLGNVFLKLGTPEAVEDAKATFEKLKSDRPQDPYAIKASKRLIELQGESLRR